MATARAERPSAAEWINVTRASKLLRVERVTVFLRMVKGDLSYRVDENKRPLVLLADVERLLASQGGAR